MALANSNVNKYVLLIMDDSLFQLQTTARRRFRWWGIVTTRNNGVNLFFARKNITHSPEDVSILSRFSVVGGVGMVCNSSMIRALNRIRLQRKALNIRSLRGLILRERVRGRRRVGGVRRIAWCESGA